MACSTDNEPDAGYATAAAAMIALALSLVVAAVLAAALQELRFSRQAFDRRQAEMALDGVQLMAVASVTRAGDGERFRWTVPSSSGDIEIVAEAEGPKLSMAEAGRLEVLQAFGVAQPERLSGLIGARAAASGGALGVEKLDPAPIWRRCAGSMISPYGHGVSLAMTPAVVPAAGRLDMRAAQMWRFRTAQRRGWVDERIVRFTGDPQNPAAVVERVVHRGGWREEACPDFVVEEDRR